MRRYKVKLTPGNMEPLAVRGDYIRITNADAELTIQPDTGAPLQGMAKGMDFKAPKTFNQVNLTSDTAQSVDVMIGFGKIEDNRATINGTVSVEGTVNVVNAGKSRTENGVAFLTGRGIGGQASQYGYIYLANPVGSGVVLVVNQLMLTSLSTTKTISIKVSEDYAALEAETGFTLVDFINGISKKVGGGAAKGLIKRGRTTQSGHVNEAIVMSPSVIANDTVPYRFTEPYVIGEGQALMVSDTVTNELIGGYFEWFEESNA